MGSYFSSASITTITNHPSFRGLFFIYCFDTYNSYFSSAFVKTTPTILQVKASSSSTTLIPTATILFFCICPQYDCQSTNIPFRSFFFIYYFAEIYTAAAFLLLPMTMTNFLLHITMLNQSLKKGE